MVFFLVFTVLLLFMHFIIFVYFPVFLCAQPHVNLNGCVRVCTCGDEDVMLEMGVGCMV